MIHDDRSKHIIESYQHDERTMILVFAQWCINNDFDPVLIYKEAYPHQPKNNILLEVLDSTVSKSESEHIGSETLQSILQVFGNDDLAFVIQDKIDDIEARKKPL